MCKLYMLVLYSFVLCFRDVGDLSLKHVGECPVCGLFVILYKLCAYVCMRMVMFTVTKELNIYVIE
jgi:hypothetical protein